MFCYLASYTLYPIPHTFHPVSLDTIRDLSATRFLYKHYLLPTFIFYLLKYDLLQLIGFRQIKYGKLDSALSESGELDTSGILGLTRHPWYLAVIIFIWIAYREMYVSTLIVNIILTIYVVMGTVLEERKLIIEFGDNYRDYKNRVSMLFPVKWIFSNKE